jgi:hypothetical protein
MPNPETWIIRNASQRPVELHYPNGVVVLPPGGTTEAAIDAQILALEHRGAVARLGPAPKPPKAKPAAPAAAAPAGKPARKARKAPKAAAEAATPRPRAKEGRVQATAPRPKTRKGDPA